MDDTECRVGGQICEVRHRHVSQDEIRLHLSLHVPGAHRGIRPHAGGQPAGDLSTAVAPDGSEFTERELALVVRRQHVGYVAAGRARSETVARALAKLVELQHGADIGNRLVLSARADPAAIQRMLAQGVDRFDLGVSLPHADAAEVVDGQPLSLSDTIGRAIVRGLSTRLHVDHREDQVDELANMDVNISINARRGAPAAEIEALTTLATEAVEDDEEFAIRTLTKARFTREELLLRSSYYDPGNEAILSVDMAWNKIAEFLDSIQ
ncbi:MAG: hypothetical protein J0I54_12155 [Bosea sp.]|uniref:hypothetical protein n=1 Tax=unclassified Bosea (in: a-proteobacteria) TaxID=2653178 RepID=UPI001AC66CCA|nr:MULTISPECIES: hypothetical protein [unclassified Bosea (in: a-proteobacteria)]MBN9457372.1 hypothetical protein [Bosea sp. (in: a-proteobacteria)]